MKTLKLLTLGSLFIALTSCSSDDDHPEHVHEEEVITTIVATLTPQGGGTDVTLTSRDIDGGGPGEPVITISGDLGANTTYNGAITLSNETEDPAEDITAEVYEEGAEHQFFFTSEIGTVAYDDTDENGDPIGLEFTLTTIDNSTTGNFTIILRHEPNKDGTGVSDGDITNANGETDLEVTFEDIDVIDE
ncbi:MAG: type 1 periplasmic binding fold superfamily protein [Flavobacteriaceae bacterium]